MFRRRPPAAPSPPPPITAPTEVGEGASGHPLAHAERAAALAAPAEVGDVRVRDGVMTIVLDVAGLAPDAREGCAARLVAGFIDSPGIRDVRVVQTIERRPGAAPADAPVAAAAAAPTQGAAPPAPAPDHPLVVMVASGKGGVGKSTVSVNLALALRRLGLRVGLVDGDIHGPSQHRLAGAAMPRPEAAGGRLVPVLGAGGLPVLSTGLLAAPGQAIAWRGPMVGKALDQLIDADWAAVDGPADAAAPAPALPRVLVIDLPPGTGDIQLSMIQRHRPAGAVIVSTPQDLALIDAMRAVDLFRRAGVPIIGMVENMAGYTCPHCGEASDPFGHGGAEAAAGADDLPFLGRVPLSLALRTASDAGTPPGAEDGPLAVPFHAIAAKVRDWLVAHPVPPAPRAPLSTRPPA